MDESVTDCASLKRSTLRRARASRCPCHPRGKKPNGRRSPARCLFRARYASVDGRRLRGLKRETLQRRRCYCWLPIVLTRRARRRCSSTGLNHRSETWDPYTFSNSRT